MIGSALLIFAYNIAVHSTVTDDLSNSVTLLEKSDAEDDVSLLTETIVYGGSYALICLLFGSLSNGGYFNPAVVIAMLI